ncbi:MAG: LamG-like jellyroll fold domain-containing protein [Thermodesulfobacteriota bacterium]
MGKRRLNRSSKGWTWWPFRYRLSGNYLINFVMADTLSVGTWYHIALVRTGNTFKIFRNGVQIGSDYTDTDGVGNLAAGAMIGRFRQGSPTYDLNGRLDEFRVSKGIARWTSNFTPPSAEY